MANDIRSQVMRKLRITWDDKETEARINDIILIAEQDLVSLLGIPVGVGESFDFSVQGMENYLFLNHCFYQWNDALDEFEHNYGPHIGRCREKWMVKQYVEGQKASADV